MNSTLTPPVPVLVERFELERKLGNGTMAARYAYVIAQRLRLEGRMVEAKPYAEECLRIAESLPAETLSDVAVDELTLGGIPLPELFHDGVVRVRLESLLDPQ